MLDHIQMGDKYPLTLHSANGVMMLLLVEHQFRSQYLYQSEVENLKTAANLHVGQKSVKLQTVFKDKTKKPCHQISSCLRGQNPTNRKLHSETELGHQHTSSHSQLGHHRDLSSSASVVPACAISGITDIATYDGSPRVYRCAGFSYHNASWQSPSVSVCRFFIS